MSDLPLDMTDGSPGHISHHLKLHQAFNSQVIGPIVVAHTTSGVDTGIAIYTPVIGDRITGLWVEPTQAWDVSGEQFGLGIAGTVDADLAFRFSAPAVPTAKATFPRGQGVGTMFGLEVVRLQTEDPIVIRSVIGGNATGAMNVWVEVMAASLF